VSAGPALPAVVFAAAALLIVVVAGVFLRSTQERQREDLRDRYADRTVVSVSLIDSLFAVALSGQVDDLSRTLRGGRVSTRALDRRALQSNAPWAVVVDSSGRVVGASSRAPRAIVQRIGSEPYVRSALRPGGYGLGDVDGEAVPTAIGFPTPSGWRAFVTAAPRRLIEAFLEGTLQPLPGVDGARAYVFDGEGRRIAAASQSIEVPEQTPQLVRALRENRARGTLDTASGERFFAVERVDNSRWRLAVTIPTDVLYASASGASRALPWVILALTAAALLGVAFLLARLVGATRELRTANAELAASNAELARSNADLEQFAYVASHDLSEPLRTVAGFSQLLGRRYKGALDPQADRFIEHMTQGVDRMQQLIDDLLVYSRVGRTPVGQGQVDLDRLLDDVVHALGPTIAERGAQITRDHLPRVHGEESLLRQVLQNLVANAIKFTADGVTPRVHVSASHERGEWRIAVSDNGIGVDPEQREAIFKMFGRLHPGDAYPGTGIGLALVKRIVERHGGRVWVEPGLGGGSVFTFTLPDRAPVREAEPREGVTA